MELAQEGLNARRRHLQLVAPGEAPAEAATQPLPHGEAMTKAVDCGASGVICFSEREGATFVGIRQTPTGGHQSFTHQLFIGRWNPCLARTVGDYQPQQGRNHGVVPMQDLDSLPLTVTVSKRRTSGFRSSFEARR